MSESVDVLFVGAGLANTLAALQLRIKHPSLRIRIIEQRDGWSDDHTWCLHESDIQGSFESHWIRPLLTKVWSHYTVEFPNLTRSITNRYAAIRSKIARPYIDERLGDITQYGSTVKQLNRHYVELADGSTISAKTVISGIGQPVNNQHAPQGYQKFLGRLLLTKEPHQIKQPVLMDARIKQFAGFRFMYLLPFGERELLMEDTRFELSPSLQATHYIDEVEQYGHKLGIEVEQILHEEKGCLPLPVNGATSPVFSSTVPTIGMAGGLFHAGTGYSIGPAIALAEWLPDVILAPDAGRRIRNYAVQHWRQQSFYRRLNSMLFFAGEQTQAHLILEKFYRLDQGVINRFYSGKVSALDKLKILSGKPPVPVGRGVAEFLRRREALA